MIIEKKNICIEHNKQPLEISQGQVGNTLCSFLIINKPQHHDKVKHALTLA